MGGTLVDPGLLESFRVTSVPDIFCIPEYLIPEEEGLLLAKIASAPAAKWKTMRHRRLQDWGGVVHPRGMVAQPLPLWLEALAARLQQDTGLFPSAINHVLVNEYQPGQGIMAHQDGPLYHPAVAIVSLGAPAVMRFSKHQSLRAEGEHSLPPAGGALLGEGNGGAARGLAAVREDFGPVGHVQGPGEGPASCRSGGGGLQEEHDAGRSDPGRGAGGGVRDPPDRQPGRCGNGCAPEAADGVGSAPDSADVALPPRSLLLFTDRAYADYLHGIEGDKCCDTGMEFMPASVPGGSDSELGPTAGAANHRPRTSLTFRTVLKVRRNLLKL